MDKNGIFLVVILLLLLILADSSNASFLFNFRKLVASLPNNNSSDTQTQVSPVSSPVSGGNESKTSPIDTINKPGNEKHNDSKGTTDSSKVDTINKPGNEKHNDSKGTINSSKVDPKSSTNKSTEKQAVKEKISQGDGKGDKTTDSQLELGTNGSCKGSSKACTDQKSMRACIHAGPGELELVIQNEGASTLKVNLTIPTSVENALQTFEISEHQTRTINISFTLSKITKIVLNAGNRDCVLHMDPPDSKGNFFRQISFYSKQVTPIYGAYFMLLVMVIFSGTWACCKLRKRKRQGGGGIPYQELEMGLPESSSAVNEDTAEGWDQDWDDDWVEDRAVKSPGGRHVGSISANGLTSRSSRKDGWENDWDG